MKERKSMVITALVLIALGLLLLVGTAHAQDNMIDADNDEMDDTWELNVIRKYGLAEIGISDIHNFSANGDPDRDGATNLEEFDAGTDPYDEGDAPGEEKVREKVTALVLLGVALCIGIPGIMAAFGLYIAGVSAVGMTTEHIDRFGKGLVLQALPMTQGIYGLIFAILLLLFGGFLGGDPAVLSDVNVGWGAIMIGITIGLTSISAIPQGLISGAAASGVGRNPEVFAKGIIYAVMPETMAVFGFLVSLFIMMGVGLL